MASIVRKPAFSLVELVVVIVIIGVIAAIAVPRISRGASTVGEVALRASLKTLRNAIEMYSAEHNGKWPGADGKEDTFTDQLFNKTDAFGNVGTTAGVHIYGPYLRSLSPVSVGPYPKAMRIHHDTHTPPKVDEDKKKLGWVYNYLTGDLIANTDDLDSQGVGYNTY